MRQDYTPLPTADSVNAPPPPSPLRRKLRLRSLLGILLILVPITILISAIALSTKSMRLCLPVQLNSISTKLHKHLACSPVPTANVTTSASQQTASNMSSSATEPGRVADFLLSQKEAFLSDLAKSNGKGWTVITGNEAGDLDSLASSIAYAYLDNSLNANRSLALTLTPRKLMTLRPENLMALQQSNIPDSVLLHPEDLPHGTEGLISAGVNIGLVDHNVLLARFGGEADFDKVKSIIDHHEDEGKSLGANPRVVKVPTGSTSSLVTNHFSPTWKGIVSSPAGVSAGPPPELATLLLSALLIDTQGLKDGGKATQDDYDAANFLYALSTLPQTRTLSTDPTNVAPALTDFADKLIAAKYDVSGLNTHQLLERDYKQYPWDTASPRFPVVNVGISTVPMSLKDQLKAEKGWDAYMAVADTFMLERGIDVLGMSTTFKSSKGKSKRELLLVVRAGGSLPDLAAAQEVLGALAKGLEADTEVFDMQPWSGKEGSKKEAFAEEAEKGLDSPTRLAKVWNQGNHRSTRKQIAPAMHAIVHALT